MAATPSKRILTYSDGNYKIEDVIQSVVQWYMQREDREVFGSVRSCASCPAVFVMKDDPHAFLGQQWQYYAIGINYNMLLEDVYLLFDRALAFANGTGFRISDDPRADWFHNKDLRYKPVNLDKVRTTARSVMTGTEQYSLMQAILDVVQVARFIVTRSISFMNARSSFVQATTAYQNVLNVSVFDSRQLPTLKPGYSYPQDISQVDPGAYKYMPETHPEKFLVANIVNSKGEVVQFPRGGLYPWTHDNTPYSFVPHIANLAYGPIFYPMSRLYKVPLGSPKPSPYRRNV